MKKTLIELKACNEAMEWVGDKTWEEVYNTCHRGDWMLWLFKRTNPDDLQLLTLAKGYCANTVRHLMTDESSIKAVDVAIAFGEGKATREELNAAFANAVDAVAASLCNYAAYAAAAAAHAANAHADATYAAAAVDEKKENQQLTADICRKYLPIKIWNI